MADTETPLNGNGQDTDGGSTPPNPGTRPVEINVPVKRGRGRPPGSGKSQGPSVSAPKTYAAPRGVVNSAPDPEKIAEAKFIGTGFVALVELAESFVHGNCARRIEKKVPAKLDEFRELAEKIGLQPKEKQILEESVGRIAQKYDWLTAHGPEFVLICVMGQYALRQGTLLRFVNAVTKPEPMENGSKNTAHGEPPAVSGKVVAEL
jgi:hypothetical protein